MKTLSKNKMSMQITEPAINYLSSIVKQQSVASGAEIVLRIVVSNAHTNLANISLSYFFVDEITVYDIRLNYANFDLYIEKQSETALIGAVIDYRINHNTNKYELHINAPNLKQPLAEHAVDNDIPKITTDGKRSSTGFSKDNSAISADTGTDNNISSMGTDNKKITTGLATESNASLTEVAIDGTASLNDLYIRINNYIEKQINSFLANHQGSVKLIRLNNLSVGVEIELEFHGGCRGCSMVQLTLKHNIEKRLKLEFKEIQSIKDITEHIVTEASYY